MLKIRLRGNGSGSLVFAVLCLRRPPLTPALGCLKIRLRGNGSRQLVSRCFVAAVRPSPQPYSQRELVSRCFVAPSAPHPSPLPTGVPTVADVAGERDMVRVHTNHIALQEREPVFSLASRLTGGEARAARNWRELAVSGDT